MISYRLFRSSSVSIVYRRFIATTTNVKSSAPRAVEKSFSDGNKPSDTSDGTYALLAALEKAKELECLKVAKLVASLEALLPRPRETSQQHTPSLQLHAHDPAFFSLNYSQSGKVSSDDISHMLQATQHGRRIGLNTMVNIIKAATEIFNSKPKITTLPALGPAENLTVIGDLHGSLSDLVAILGLTGEPSPKNKLLFNGDFADRGEHGIEVIVIVCALYLAFPDQVFINRGNHEDLALSVAYGLYSELQHKYSSEALTTILAPLLGDFFRSLPLLTVLGNDALVVHGGPPPPGVSICDMENMFRNCRGLSRTIVQDSNEGEDSKQQKEKIVESLLWSDPEVDEERGEMKNSSNLETIEPRQNVSRGAGFLYDAGTVKTFLEKEGFNRLIRSHEPVWNGCSRFVIGEEVGSGSASRKNKSSRQSPLELFTVFSASLYPNKEGFNQGAILRLNPDGSHDIFRYSTASDEPMVDHADGFPADDRQSTDLDVLRRTLRRAIGHRRVELEKMIENAVSSGRTDIPFTLAIDTLLRFLDLENEGLMHNPKARLALAKALLSDEENANGNIPGTFNLSNAIGNLFKLEHEDEIADEGEFCMVHPWLNAVFAIVDINDDGVISKQEWFYAVSSINEKLPAGMDPIDAEDTWKMLDSDNNGEISRAEWGNLNNVV